MTRSSRAVTGEVGATVCQDISDARGKVNRPLLFPSGAKRW